MNKNDFITDYIEKHKLFVCSRTSDIYVQKEGSQYYVNNLNSLAIQQDLTDEYITIYDEPPSDTQIKKFIKLLRYKSKKLGKSVFIANSRSLFIDNKIYIDRGNNKGIISISRNKRSLLNKTKFYFVDNEFQEEFPKPNTDDDNRIKILWDIINIKNPDHKKLLFVWMLHTFFTDMNYVILVLFAKKGSAKSFTQRVLKTILDPSSKLLRNPPKQLDDIVLAAINSHIVDYNNVSDLKKSMQDDLCNLSTGATFTTRKLFSNGEEYQARLKNPVILNGNTDFITEDDLLDRCIILNLPEIDSKERKTEKELLSLLNEHKESIFSAILQYLQKVLVELDNITRPKRLPRMADFYLFGLAVEKACQWEIGSFKKAYKAILKSNTYIMHLNNPLLDELIALKLNGGLPFTGTYKELNGLLSTSNSYEALSDKGLAIEIMKICPLLKTQHGIKIERLKRQSKGYPIHIYEEK